MAEQINKLAIIDETLNFISPEIIAEADSSERVLPILKLSQLALSVFHPDRDQIEASGFKQERGIHALTRINALVKSFENDNDLAELFYSTSREIVDDSGEKIRTEINLLNNTRLIREQITVKPEQVASTHNQIEPTGEVVELVANQKLLAMLLGKQVISLLANTGQESLKSIMPLLKKKFMKVTDSPFGIDITEWSTLFDEVQQTGKIDESQTENSNTNGLTSEEILQSLEEQRFQAFSTLLELLKPNEKLVYPENWYRSFNGKIVCPTDMRAWPNYESFTVLNHDVELRALDVYEVEDGIIQTSIRLDTSARDSIDLIRDIKNDGQKKWLKSLVNYVAETIDYQANKFTKESKHNNNNNPMDFIFEVTDDQKINIIYTRPRDRRTEDANNQSISFEDIDFPKNSSPLEAGYYMVKAGKNSKTKKYNVNPPVALIKLVPEYNDQFVGNAFIGGQSNLYSGVTILDSYSNKVDQSPDPNTLPALLGSNVSFEKVRLFNMFNLAKGLENDALLSEFINDGSLLYHLTFIDDGDYLGASQVKGVSTKTPGRVYSQTSLSGHRARLIKSK